MMKPSLWITGVLGIGLTASVTIAATGYVPVAAPGTRGGMIEIGGLTKEEAAKKIRTWWEAEKAHEITLRLDEANKEYTARPGQMGVTIDDAGSLAAVDFRDFWENAKGIVDKTDENGKFPIKFKKASTDVTCLAELSPAKFSKP